MLAFDWLVAYAFTQAIEAPIHVRALGQVGAPGRPVGERIAIALGASALTHPFVWFVFPIVWWWTDDALAYRGLVLSPNASYAWFVVAAESVVVAVEALYLSAFGVRRAILWSLGANAASAGLGFLSRWLFGVP